MASDRPPDAFGETRGMWLCMRSALDLANGQSGHTAHCFKEGRQECRMERLYIHSLSSICCFHAGGVAMMAVMMLPSL